MVLTEWKSPEASSLVVTAVSRKPNPRVDISKLPVPNGIIQEEMSRRIDEAGRRQVIK
jgi:hypothetical protein